MTPVCTSRPEGHAPSLAAALIHFDVSFMVWVLLGALGAYIGQDLGLSPGATGVLVAVPLLSAAFWRVGLGVLGDRFGPKRVGTASMALVLLPLAWGWLGGGGYGELLGVGLLLGAAGASFAVSLPLASRSYPPHRQGLAMGIAGAGNSGSVLSALVAPRLAEQLGWRPVLGLALVPVLLALLAFVVLAREPPPPPRPLTAGALRRLLGERDAWRLCGLYAVTFGGFVGLAGFGPVFFHDQYGLSKVDAATLTASGAALGSLLRPVGGYGADRWGGTAVLTAVYGLAAALLIFSTGLPAIGATAVALVATMATLGIGNGAVFQLVGIRFGDRIGTVGGLVGAAGGVGGFLLPTVLGMGRDLAGSYAPGLALIAAMACVALAGTIGMRGAWRRGQAAAAGAPA